MFCSSGSDVCMMANGTSSKHLYRTGTSSLLAPPFHSPQKAFLETDSSHNDQYVHELMTTPPYIEGSGEPSLWYAGSIDRRACKVQDSQPQEVVERHPPVDFRVTVEKNAVDDWEEGRRSKKRVHVEPYSSVRWLTEVGPQSKYR